MHIHCTHCNAIHETSSQALLKTSGIVHCPHCGKDFDAVEQLARETAATRMHGRIADTDQQQLLDLDIAQEEIPATRDPSPEAHEADARTDSIPEISSHEPDDGEPDPEEHAQPIPTEPPRPAASDDHAPSPDEAVPADAPSFVGGRVTASSPAHRARNARWLVAVLLTLLLAGQGIIAERNRLAENGHWRPWLERACAFLACALPDWHDPAALRILTRDVRPHPTVTGALMISASFRNEARWAQAWPRLQLTLSNLDGKAIAQRRFSPEEYLGPGTTMQRIEPGQVASISLEVRDPGKQAVAFEFEFN